MSSFAFEPPTELIEIILSHLRNDVPALARCSLVDREWLSMCRRWLFEEVNISTNRASTRQARFHKFMDLFEKSTAKAPCTLNRYIQCLVLDPTFTPYQISGLATIDLPNLHAIRFNTHGSDSLVSTVPSYLLSSISTTFSEKVHRLDVASLLFPTPLALVEFVCAFPNLCHLALGDNGFINAEWRPPATSLKLSSGIVSLRWSQRLVITRRELIEWLLDQIQQQKIEIKSLEYLANGGYNISLPELIAATAEKIEQIDIYLDSSDGGAIESLASSHFSFDRLQNIQLVCAPGAQSITYWKGTIDTVLGTLVSSLDAPQLSQLSLGLSTVANTTCPMHVLRHTPFERFDAALSKKDCTNSGSLPALRTVKFLVGSCGARPCAGSKASRMVDDGSENQRYDGAWKRVEGGRVETFEELASGFLDEAFPRASAEQKISLLVSRVVKL